MTSEPLFIFAAIVAILTIAPLAPAILLFLFLPSRAMVSGPFKGFKVDLSGSIAAYFIIFLALISLPRDWVSKDIYEVKTISGTIYLAEDPEEEIDPRKLGIAISPAPFKQPQVTSSRSINWWLDVLKPVKSENSWPIEGIIVRYPNYGSKMIKIHSGKYDENTGNHVLPDAELNPPEIKDATHVQSIVIR